MPIDTRPHPVGGIGRVRPTPALLLAGPCRKFSPQAPFEREHRMKAKLKKEMKKRLRRLVKKHGVEAATTLVTGFLGGLAASKKGAEPEPAPPPPPTPTYPPPPPTHPPPQPPD